jgi:hypothetical protein
MKRAALICPERRNGLEDIMGDVPLVLAVYLGKPFMDHALYGLARQGYEHVLVFVSDRPAAVRDYIGNGAAWGLKVDIMPTSAEITVEQAKQHHGMTEEELVWVLDSLPQAPDVPVLADLEAWHASRASLIPLLVPGQVGAREQAPGVWVGMRVRIAPTAVLEAPAWIGHQSIIGGGAKIGPFGYVENDSIVDGHAEVRDSTLGARTYLGGMTHLAGSIACGSALANWSNGSIIRLTDAFLLSPLDVGREVASGSVSRVLAAVALAITSPLLLLAVVLAPVRGKPWWISRRAVVLGAPGMPLQMVTYHECPALPWAWSRWPRLWRIVTGHFSWTGNPPISPAEADGLELEFERLWLHAPPALFTAPEAEGCAEPWDDEAKAHAALFATAPTFAWRKRILCCGLRSLLYPPGNTP